MRLLLTTALVLGVASTSALAGSFTSLDNAQNGFLSALSRNGRIASGVYVSFGQYAGSFAWREGAGAADIAFGSVLGMNSWAQPMVGADVDDDGAVIAAMAYSDLAINGPTPIGPYPGSTTLDNFYSQAYGVSDDGVVVGLAYDPSLNPIAFRWTKLGGMTRLAVDRPTTYSRANGISADGSTIFGWNDQLDGYRRGVIWIGGKPIEPHNPGIYGDNFGSPPGEALGANASGSVVVGQGYWNEAFESLAWRWTAATDAQPIGIIYPPPPSAAIQDAMSRLQPPSGPFANCRYRPYGFFSPPASYALGVSEDGNTIVGNTSDGFTTAAFIWTAANGMELLSDYAAAHGVSVPAGFYLYSANAISADGLTIGGNGIDPSGSFFIPWIIDLRPASERDAIVMAQGTVIANDLVDGPFQGFPPGAAVTMDFHVTRARTVLEPAHESTYPVVVQGFRLSLNYQDPVDFTRYSASEGLAPASTPQLHLVNDQPLADAIALPASAMATPGQELEFAFSNPDGTLFDSDAADRINRSFGPGLFDTKTWIVRNGAHQMTVALQWIRIKDDFDTILRSGFED